MKYRSILSLIETEQAIKILKDTFETNLAKTLHLLRVSAPLFVQESSGLNDQLNGVEKPVIFYRKESAEALSIVQSLAKWKRHALLRYQIPHHMGIYTDMNAIRKDEELDALHSLYVDQWDWEKIIHRDERNLATLFSIVNSIYEVILQTQTLLLNHFPKLKSYFPPKIHFISSLELFHMYPNHNAKQRENLISQKYGAVFIYQIGGHFPNGELRHDHRAPDYDDWELNGDILIFYPPLECAVELSSMGIRVDKKALLIQLERTNQSYLLAYPYHQQVLLEQLPFTIGGGIGQSRLCLVMLNKIHICEVQASVWDKATLDFCKENDIIAL